MDGCTTSITRCVFSVFGAEEVERLPADDGRVARDGGYGGRGEGELGGVGLRRAFVAAVAVAVDDLYDVAAGVLVRARAPEIGGRDGASEFRAGAGRHGRYEHR